MITLQVEGIEGLNKDLKDYGEKAAKAIRDGVYKTALAIETDAAKRLSGKLGSERHWITGRLATSIYTKVTGGWLKPGTNKGSGGYNYQVPQPTKGMKSNYDGTLQEEPGPLDAFVGTNVEYAAKIEFEKDSYLNWAATNQQNNLSKRIEKELNNIK